MLRGADRWGGPPTCHEQKESNGACTFRGKVQIVESPLLSGSCEVQMNERRKLLHANRTECLQASTANLEVHAYVISTVQEAGNCQVLCATSLALCVLRSCHKP